MNDAMNDRPTAIEIAEQWQGVLKSLEASMSTPEITLKKMTGKGVPYETVDQFIDAASKLVGFLRDAVANEIAEHKHLHSVVQSYRGLVGELLRSPDTFDPQIVAMMAWVFDPSFDSFGIGHVDFDSTEFQTLRDGLQEMVRDGEATGREKEDEQ